MLRLVTIDLSNADLDLFERYEAQVLSLLPRHGARLRLRTADATAETHLLEFPDAAAYDRYRADPDRLALAPLLEQSRARTTSAWVEEIAPP